MKEPTKIPMYTKVQKEPNKIRLEANHTIDNIYDTDYYKTFWQSYLNENNQQNNSQSIQQLDSDTTN